MRAVARLTCPYAVALIAAGCGSNQYDSDAWLLPEKHFATTVRTIALVSTEAPDGLDDPDPAQALFDSLLAAELQAAGFSVVSIAATGAIWERLVDSVGGYYDPFTGRKDTTRLNAVRRSWQHILRDTLGADAALFPRIVVVDAPVKDGKASWDGASQWVWSFGQTLHAVVDAALSGLAGTQPAPPSEETTLALSLEVVIEGLDGEPMYENRGGIEVWAKPGRPVSRADLFQDMERNVKAVRVALGPILARRDIAQSH